MPLLPGIDYPVSNTLNGPYVLLNAQGSPLTIATIDGSVIKACTIDYAIVRSSTTETGRILISTDGTTLGFEVDKTSNSDTGVTLLGSMSGSNILIQYMSTNTGQTATFKYSQLNLS